MQNKWTISRLLSLTVCLLFTAGPSLAEEQGDRNYLPEFRLHLNDTSRRELLKHKAYGRRDILYPELSSFESHSKGYDQGLQLKQYDAQLYYPVSPLHGMSLDLGVNIKYLNAVSRNQQADGLVATHNFNEAIPMVYATALFNLPFQGLSAGIEGSHLDYDHTRAFDYTAKLRYHWNQEFGLEGGWQHQQYSLDNGQLQPGLEYESKGLYLDLFMNF